ncbi:MAG: hypothetical protein K6B74_14075 [Ruminococcus sp.]|nr:hypothetical protein [Ruminococcus sp.]
MNKNLTNEELDKEQLDEAVGGAGDKGGSKKMTIVCPECGNTVTVTVKAFSGEVTCPICKKSYVF